MIVLKIFILTKWGTVIKCFDFFILHINYKVLLFFKKQIITGIMELVNFNENGL